MKISYQLALLFISCQFIWITPACLSQESKILESLDLENLSHEDCLFIDSNLRANATINDEEKIKYYKSMQVSYKDHGNFLLALYCSDSLINLFNRNGKKEKLAETLQGKSMLHDLLGQYPEALKASQEGLNLYIELNDKKGESNCYNDIGVINYYGGNQETAKNYFNKAFEIYKEIKDTVGITMYYNNMANTLFEEDDLGNALDMYLTSHEYTILLNNIPRQCISLSNIGETYTAMELFALAEKTLLEALGLAESMDDPWLITNPLRGLGDLYQRMGEFEKAIHALERSVKICNEIEAVLEQSQNYELLYTLYKKKGDYKSSLSYFELYRNLDDSLYTIEKDRMMDEMETKYQLDDKAKEIALITNEKKIDNLRHQQEMHVQKNRQMLLSLGLMAFAIVIFLAVRGIIIKKRTNRQLLGQNTLIQGKNDELHYAYNQIEEKKSEILDSIRYAKRIQQAILPPRNLINKLLPRSFVLYKPKDLIAGDFFWLEEQNGAVLFAAADCTGHGVPGAMISVVCNNGLNRSVREYKLSDPGSILNKTREIVLQEFGKSEERINDGMDIALCNLKGNKLTYAGAHNPLWIVRKGGTKVEEIAGNKQPIGIFDTPQPFNTHELKVSEGDTIYIFSDGYADQFGGEKGKKMKTVNFKKLLISLNKFTMVEQLAMLDEAFDKWKGQLEQLDDICVIGVRV